MFFKKIVHHHLTWGPSSGETVATHSLSLTSISNENLTKFKAQREPQTKNYGHLSTFQSTFNTPTIEVAFSVPKRTRRARISSLFSFRSPAFWLFSWVILGLRFGNRYHDKSRIGNGNLDCKQHSDSLFQKRICGKGWLFVTTIPNGQSEDLFAHSYEEKGSERTTHWSTLSKKVFTIVHPNNSAMSLVVQRTALSLHHITNEITVSKISTVLLHIYAQICIHIQVNRQTTF